ncbi:hypothetical protein P8605_47660, partial [Streptomyces sp. T-3]|nr:hypothetical protein [Streptomyces sp. T-3]
ARVTRTGPAAATRARDVLDAVGLTEGWQLRHPAVAAAVLDGTEPAERIALHVRAARTLYDGGAKAGAVAQHLLFAHALAGPRTTAVLEAVVEEGRAENWAVPVLREVARKALLDDDSGYGLDCLALARELTGDIEDRWQTTLHLASVLRGTDPAAAEHHLDECLRALRRGELGHGAGGLLARLLLTQGCIEWAAEALEHTARRREVGALDEDPLWGLFAPAGEMSASEGRRTSRANGPSGLRAEPDVLRTPLEVSAQMARAAAVQWPPPSCGADENGMELLLKDTPLTHATFDLVVQAVRALAYADRCDRAVVWCQKLQAEADRSRFPGWYAVLGLQHAQALLGLGDLPGARHAAADAGAAVTDRGGLLLFGLVAVEITALTQMGRYDEAARRLEPPVPQALFHSVYALDHLRARGLYHLATHHPRAALADFLRAGTLARSWALDRPRHLPWRTDAAAALVQLGQHRQAAHLITEQLALPDANS